MMAGAVASATVQSQWGTRVRSRTNCGVHPIPLQLDDDVRRQLPALKIWLPDFPPGGFAGAPLPRGGASIAHTRDLLPSEAPILFAVRSWPRKSAGSLRIFSVCMASVCLSKSLQLSSLDDEQCTNKNSHSPRSNYSLPKTIR
jgi:hypothetical protein